MALFNVMVGIGVGVLACLPLFLVKGSKARGGVLVLAIILAVGGAHLSKATLYPHYLGWRFEQEIKKQPLFTLIAQIYPQAFSEFIQKVKQSIGKNEDAASVSVYSARMVNKIFYQSLRQAPDDYIALYLKATLDLYHHLNGQDPRAVLKLENGDTSSVVDMSAFYERKEFQSLLNHLLDTKRYIIEAGVKTPVPPPSDTQAEPLLQGILNDLANKFSEPILQAAFTKGQTLVPPNVAAQIIIEFYANILGQGRENAGIIMRHIADLKTRAKENHPSDSKQEVPLIAK